MIPVERKGAHFAHYIGIVPGVQRAGRVILRELLRVGSSISFFGISNSVKMRILFDSPGASNGRWGETAPCLHSRDLSEIDIAFCKEYVRL